MFMIRQEGLGEDHLIKSLIRMKALIMVFSIFHQKVIQFKSFIKSLISKKILKKWRGRHVFLNTR